VAMARKHKFKVAVYATYTKVVEVLADNEDHAEREAVRMWSDDKITMGPLEPGVGFDDVEFSCLGPAGRTKKK